VDYLLGEKAKDGISKTAVGPNWRCVSVPRGATLVLHLFYFPTGEQLEVTLRQCGALWRLSPA